MTTAVTNSLPDIGRSDVEIVAIRQWDVTSAGEQRARVDAVREDWERASWPQGLLSVSCFASTSDVTSVGLLLGTHAEPGSGHVARLRVLTYAQWTSAEAYRHFQQRQETGPITEDASVAGTSDQSPPPVEYRLYRSHHNLGSHPPSAAPGLVVIVVIEFDAPSVQRQQRWIDGVLDALEAETEPVPGLMAAHFHTSTDGRRVINYAEWFSDQAYSDALDRGPEGVGQTDLPEWRHVRAFPGVINNTVTRYVLQQAFRSPPTANSRTARL